MKQHFYRIFSFFLALLLCCFSFAETSASSSVIKPGKDLPENCRKDHFTNGGYFSSLKVAPARVLLIEDGTVYFRLTTEEKPESSNASLTDETKYPAEFLRADQKTEWILIWCETHKTVYRVLQAAK